MKLHVTFPLLYLFIVIAIHFAILQSTILDQQLVEEWNAYKERYNKTYGRLSESIRRVAWHQNFLSVMKHNDEAAIGLHNYTLRLNHLADMDIREYMRRMIKLIKSIQKQSEENVLQLPYHDSASIPDELDWREKGYKTAVMNQGHCGACYAFTIAAAIEAQTFIKSGHIKQLSVQQLVDCSKLMGNMGCRGGSFRNTLAYVEKEGITSTDKYLYAAKESPCRYKKSDKVVEIQNWNILPAKDETVLKTTVAIVGPIAVSINASPSTFQLYHKGIYDDPKCSSDTVNHAMLLIGYTKDAWILKNWWTESWGDSGYMYLRRNNNHCGIANYAASVNV